MLITFDYNSDTNEFTPISKEIVEETKAVKKTAKAKVETIQSNEPQIILEDNKYVLNQAAADLLGVKWEDRVSIKYQKVEGLLFPIIGKDEAFQCAGGNKVTKSLTVSCRGNANERLSRYGNIFTLSQLKDNEGLFVLNGNAERPQEPDPDEVKVPESEEFNDIDLPLDTDLDLELDENTFEITDETFQL